MSPTGLTPRLGPSSPLPVAPQPGAPVVPTEPVELAIKLTSAWQAIEAHGVDAAPEAHVYQVATRALAKDEALEAHTYERLDPALREQVVADVQAARGLRSLVGKPRTSLPPWRIVGPPPAEELLAYYREAETDFGVPWPYLAAISLVETRNGRIRGTSEAGAAGPLQFLPMAWVQYGEGGDINSYRDSIRAAARYLKRNGAPTDMRNALWNYNHDYHYVDAVTRYAERMAVTPVAYFNYYGWQVYYVTTAGDIWLPEGYGT